MGKKVLATHTISNYLQDDLKEVVKGVYFLLLRSGSGISTKRVIVQ